VVPNLNARDFSQASQSLLGYGKGRASPFAFIVTRTHAYHTDVMKTTRSCEDYLVSVVDSDGDQVLVDAPIQAFDTLSAWEQATLSAFRTCQGTGAMPKTITVVRITNPE
jgi:predicted Zn-dependent protease with MMP-like domain